MIQKRIAVPPKKRHCTAFVNGHKCANYGMCTRVEIYSNLKEAPVHKHWVCAVCRERMDLPDHSVMVKPAPLLPDHKRLREAHEASQGD